MDDFNDLKPKRASQLIQAINQQLQIFIEEEKNAAAVPITTTATTITTQTILEPQASQPLFKPKKSVFELIEQSTFTMDDTSTPK